MQTSPKKTHGFSLIELSIVMAVMSMMATALVPNMLAQHQEKLVEATVETYYHIADAAQAYHTANGAWPGFDDVGGDCAPNIVLPTTPLEVLAADGYIHSANLANPWQDVFTLKAVPLPIGCVAAGAAEPCSSCGLELASKNIPVSAQNMLTKLLPMAECDATDTCTAEMTAGDGAGGDALPTGAVMMFEDGCPAGWAEVDAMKGRMPVGAGELGDSSGLAPYVHRDKGGTVGFTLMGSATMGTRGWVKKNMGGDACDDPGAEYCTERPNGVVGHAPSAFDQLNLNKMQWRKNHPIFDDGFVEQTVDSANQACLGSDECPDNMDSGWLKGAYTDLNPSAYETNMLETIPPYYVVAFCTAL